MYDASAGTTFNEAGADRDFRVESDTNTHALFVDAGTSRVGINKSSPSGYLHILGSNDQQGATLYLQEANNNTSDFLGTIYFGNNTQDNLSHITSYTNTNSTTSYLQFNSTTTGSVRRNLDLGATAVVLNEDSADIDFRVESDNNANALFVDASANHVSFFGTSNAAMDGVQGVQIGDTSSTSAGLGMATANHSFLLYIDNSNDLLSLYDSTNNVDRMQLLNDGTFVFNQTGEASADFRIEALGSQYAFFVDSGNSSVAMGTSTPASYVNTGGLAVKGSTYSDLALISSSIASGSNSHQLRFYNEAGASYEIARMRVNVGAGQVNRGEIQFSNNNGATLRPWLDVDYGNNVVFNSQSYDADFRVSSDANTHMLFVDAGSNHVNIGTSSDRGGILNVYGSVHPIVVIESESDGTVLSLRTTDTDANAGPNLELYRNATGAANDNLGSIIVKGTDASAQDQVYFSIGTQISAAGNGVEASTVYFQNAVAGTLRERITMSSSALVINQEGLDNDFRVECQQH